MCSYNAVNGIPSCANGFFNNEVARNQWGWDGFMVSDCGAIDNIQNEHHYTSDENATIKVAIEGGTDVNCGSFYNTYIYGAYVNGSITLADLQQAATRFLTTIFWLGLMDPAENVVYTTYNNTFVDTPAHRQLAFEAATQSIILLQNNPTNTPWGANQPLLPLQGNKLKKIALIGPNANATQTLLSNYHGTNTLVNNQSILLSLQRRGVTDGFTVDFSVGCPYISCADTSEFGAATAAAQAADLAIVVVGLCSDNCPGGSADDPVHEGEGHDRINTTLPGFQEQLVLDIAATGTPTLVVLVHGGALAIDQTKVKVATILDALYPGEMGGDAVTAVLFGDVSPAGRTTTTWYPAAYQFQRPLVTDMELAPHGNVAGVTYLYYNGTTLWPFGWGLSYTTFAFNWLSDDASMVSVDAESFASCTSAPVYAVNVTNTGAVTSDVSALAFFSTNVAGEPLTELFDFQRTAALAPRQSVVMYFTLPPTVAALVTPAGDQVVMPGKFTVRIGDVAAGNFVEGTLQVTGKAQTLFSYVEAEKHYAQTLTERAL
jgi:beta-D-xylosidase 4